MCDVASAASRHSCRPLPPDNDEALTSLGELRDERSCVEEQSATCGSDSCVSFHGYRKQKLEGQMQASTLTALPPRK